ncbi:hypothetical protein Ddye_008506, partial [Dipteronia dyeriana]
MDNLGDKKEMDQLIYVSGRLIQVYLEHYVLKTPCTTSSQTRQGIRNRNAQERFQLFDETVSRYFDVMLDILYEMSKVMIKSLDPEFRSTPLEILSDSRYMSHFK